MNTLCVGALRARLFSGGALVAGAMMLGGAPALATDWLEPRANDQDAGEYAAQSQVPVGLGELESITGRLDGGFMGPGFGAPPGVPDFQDLFLIQISVPSLFTARTVPFGFEDIDTELFLFSVGGFGLLNNDNEFGPPIPFSYLVPVATDGSFNLTTPGLYVIGVAGAGNVPTSGGLPIFNRLTATEVSGPDGAGGGGVHDGWITNEIEGRYVIELTGAQYAVPGVGTGAAMALGGLLACGRRRRAR